jgi:uncharacterized protein
VFLPLPDVAAWRHVDAREGFEVVFIRERTLTGYTSAVEGGAAWAVRWEITVDDQWRTTVARVTNHSAAGAREIHVERGVDGWYVDGLRRGDLDGCDDVDLEATACTNTLPIHRLQLAVGAGASAPAVYIRAEDLDVVRLEQQYTRVSDASYEYASPAFDTYCRLEFDASGLVVDYPGLAARVV